MVEEKTGAEAPAKFREVWRSRAERQFGMTFLVMDGAQPIDYERLAVIFMVSVHDDRRTANPARLPLDCAASNRVFDALVSKIFFAVPFFPKPVVSRCAPSALPETLQPQSCRKSALFHVFVRHQLHLRSHVRIHLAPMRRRMSRRRAVRRSIIESASATATITAPERSI